MQISRRVMLAAAPALMVASVSGRPRAVVDFYGPTDFGNMDADMRQASKAANRRPRRVPADSPASIESLLVGYPVSEYRPRASAVSPTERLRRASAAADPGAKIDSALLPHQGHSTAAFSRGEVLVPLAGFLSRYLSH